MDKLLLKTIAGKEKKKIPIWFMRQAGRYLPEYRKIKEEVGGFLKMVTTPEIAAEVSLQPLRRFDLDAAIFFCDILTPLIPMGIKIDFSPAPIIQNPIEKKSDIEQLQPVVPAENLSYVGKTLQLIRQQLPADKCLIGFGGAPFTLASYLFKKKNAADFSSIKKFCFKEPESFFLLMKKLEQLTIDYLQYQIDSGAEIIQIFDSWAGCFHLDNYRKFVLPSVKKIVCELKKKSTTPIIYYLNGGSHLIEAMLESGADVVSIDHRTELTQTHNFIQQNARRVLLQGNLDPFYLFAEDTILEKEIKKIATQFDSTVQRGNWIFNLSQGLDKNTPISKLELTIQTLRNL